MAYNLIIEHKADATLEYLEKFDHKQYIYLIDGLNDIEENGFFASSVKNIGDGVFRKRVGRWRILFGLYLGNIHIRIIDIEKDTKKDYQIRTSFIKSTMKNRGW